MIVAITVYSKPNCPHCEAAKAYLTAHAIPFSVIDVTQNPEALAFIKGRGHKTVPQLYVGDAILVQGGSTGLQKLHPDDVRARLSEIAGDRCAEVVSTGSSASR